MRSIGLAVLVGVMGCGTPVPAGSPDYSVPADMTIVSPPDLTATPDFSLPDLTYPEDMLISPTVIEHGLWLELCKYLTGCGVYPTNVSYCTAHGPQAGALPFESKAVLSCIQMAGANCDAIKTCLNLGDANFACNGANPNPTCKGDVYSVCLMGSNNLYSVNCAMPFGLVCTTPVDFPGNPGCGFGSCPGPADAGVTTSCVAGVQAICQQERLRFNEDCRVFANSECAILDGGVAACVGKGGACVASSCVGTVLHACKAGFEATFDCANEKLSCDKDAMGVFGCRNGSACDPETFLETCLNGVLTYCDFGIKATMDCMGAGLRCVPQDNLGNGGFCMK